VEASGFVLRGRFTPGVASDEFCDRRLLARIHRYTLDRLRREIDPVSAQDYMRFLLRWQHLTPDAKLAGKTGVRQAIARLEGYEAASSAWERELLAARISDYRSSWLDELCLGGEVVWARLTPRKSANGGATPTRSTPITLALRRDFETLLSAVRGGEAGPAGPKTGAAAEILDLLRHRGALFFDEIVNGTRRLRSDVERGLRELVAWGLVTADGFQGLRQLLGRAPHQGRPRTGGGSSYTASGFFAGGGPAGRWSLIQQPHSLSLGEVDSDELAEAAANVLLQRYGVVFRDLYPRESLSLPWRDVLRALRRLEARGLVRGGRFVSGFNGEQYALPDAVDSLRRVRKQERTGERIWVSAADPANLSGIVVPGPKLPSVAGKGLLYVDGLPEAQEERWTLKEPAPSKLAVSRRT
jgi:ATP-dependent Lhr-like helicase